MGSCSRCITALLGLCCKHCHFLQNGFLLFQYVIPWLLDCFKYRVYLYWLVSSISIHCSDDCIQMPCNSMDMLTYCVSNQSIWACACVVVYTFMTPYAGHTSVSFIMQYTCSEVADRCCHFVPLFSILLLSLCLDAIIDIRCVALPLCNLISLINYLVHTELCGCICPLFDNFSLHVSMSMK